MKTAKIVVLISMAATVAVTGAWAQQGAVPSSGKPKLYNTAKQKLLA